MAVSSKTDWIMMQSRRVYSNFRRFLRSGINRKLLIRFRVSILSRLYVYIDRDQSQCHQSSQYSPPRLKPILITVWFILVSFIISVSNSIRKPIAVSRNFFSFIRCHFFHWKSLKEFKFLRYRNFTILLDTWANKTDFDACISVKLLRIIRARRIFFNFKLTA